MLPRVRLSFVAASRRVGTLPTATLASGDRTARHRRAATPGFYPVNRSHAMRTLFVAPTPVYYMPIKTIDVSRETRALTHACVGLTVCVCAYYYCCCECMV